MASMLPALELSSIASVSCQRSISQHRAGRQVASAAQRQYLSSSSRANERLSLLARQLHSSSSERSASSTSSSSSSSESATSGSSSSSDNSSAKTEATSDASSAQGKANQTKPRFRFNLAASFIGKPMEAGPDGKPRHPKYAFDFSQDSPVRKWRDEILRLQKDKHVTPGDDFLFTLTNKKSGSCSFGVADGVGGWSESGVNPALFAQTLMYHAQREAQRIDRETKDWSKEGMYPHDILKCAYEDTLKEDDVKAGSATAMICTLDPFSGRMRAANLGDSGFSLIRNSKVVHVQPPQQHYFNCPYQLSKLPDKMASDPGSILDLPDRADLFETQLQSGDLIVAYTDGFSDNVFPYEVETLIQRIQQNNEKLKYPEGKQRSTQHIADALRNYARLCADKEDKKSPFEAEAKKHGLIYKGGKMDDITIVVANVTALDGQAQKE